MNIENKLNVILKKRSGIDFLERKDLCTEKLLGSKINMPSRELFHVYFDIEEEFGIRIPEKDIVDMNFDTLEHIEEIIRKQLALC